MNNDSNAVFITNSNKFIVNDSFNNINNKSNNKKFFNPGLCK